jgi:flagellin
MTVAVNFNAVAAGNARYISKASDALGAAQQRLASGTRVADTSYDAAGAAVGAVLASDLGALEQAGRSAAIGSAVADFMIGALGTQMDLLTRMRALAGQSVSDSVGDDSDRALIQAEFAALLGQVDSIATNTKWLGADLLSSSSAAKSFVVGLDAANKVTISATKTDKATLGLVGTGSTEESWGVSNMSSGSPYSISDAAYGTLNTAGGFTLGGSAGSRTLTLAAGSSLTQAQYTALNGLSPAIVGLILTHTDASGSGSDIAIATKGGAEAALTAVSTAIETVATNIATLGAKKAELKYAAETISVESINKSAAKGTIVDADVTAELQNVQTQKALFDMSSAMFSKSLKKQDDLAQMVKNA